MITDIAARIAGEDAEVVGLLGAGIDPHLYKPTRTDVETLLSARLILANGLHLEGKMTEVFERAAGSGRRVVAVAEALDESLLLVPADGAGQHDPHVWMDPTAWARVAGVIRDALTELAPEHGDEFAARAEACITELGELHAYAERVLGSVPPKRRVLVTAHDAFGYFGRRYGFEVVGIQGISTESEAGVRDIERIVSLLADRAIPAVFVESTVSERNIRALIEGARARGHEVTIGASLYSDAMGEAGTYEGTYTGMIDHNVTAIARALGGDAPERGMLGRLTP
jgi:manganese/zinc/iron transport system substrate-binding protein